MRSSCWVRAGSIRKVTSTPCGRRKAKTHHDGLVVTLLPSRRRSAWRCTELLADLLVEARYELQAEVQVEA